MQLRKYMLNLKKHGMRLFPLIGMRLNKPNYILLFFACLFVLMFNTLNILQLTMRWKNIKTLRHGTMFPVCYWGLLLFISVAVNHKRWIQLFEKISRFENISQYPAEFQLKQTKIYSISEILILVYYYGAVTCTLYFLTTGYFKYTLTFDIDVLFTCDLEDQERSCYLAKAALSYPSIFFVFFGTHFFDGLFVYIVANIQREFQVIEYKLNNLNYASVDVRQEFYKIIDQHDAVLSAGEDLNGLTTMLFLQKYWSGTLTVCLGIFLINIDGFPPSLDSITGYGSFLFAFSMQLAIHCFTGTVLITESLRISDVAFHSEWYTCEDRRVRNEVILLIQRAQKAANISIGGLSYLDLEKFPMMMKFAFSFYTLISSMDTSNITDS